MLVVCTAGISRSATICIAYLIKKHHLSYNLALSRVKSARMFVNPNQGFVKFLQAYEKQLRKQEVEDRLKSNPKLKRDCELCTLERRTQWFERHTQCQSN